MTLPPAAANPLEHVRSLRCVVCHKEYAPDEVAYVCPEHGNEGILDVQYDYELVGARISRASLAEDEDPTMWRYKPLMPVAADAAVPPLTVGRTPMYREPGLAGLLGLDRVWVKDEGRQPTGSLKDRASAIAILKAREREADVITTASTGNAAAALSGLCASVDQSNVIFVPETAPQAKVAQLLVFGSAVVLVEGTYGQAFELCMQAAEHYGWYNRNTGFNPYMTEGKKTASLEICEQLEWDPPDVIVVSVGDGSIIGGLHKGLKDASALGWIDRMPRLVGVQAEGSSFMVQAWERGENVLTKQPVEANTIADSISAELPRDRVKAMAAVTETDGAFLSVTDDEILAAVPALARATGIFAEPAGAASYAGLIKAREVNVIEPDERVVVLNTGNGLKDVASAMKAVEDVGTAAHRVAPDLAELQHVLSAAGFGEGGAS